MNNPLPGKWEALQREGQQASGVEQRARILAQIIRDTKANAGQRIPDTEDLHEQICSWDEAQLRHVPTCDLIPAYLYAQNTRTNTASACNAQNIRAAHQEMVGQGRATSGSPARQQPDPHCPDCRGIGFRFEVERRGADFLSGAEGRAYEIAIRCGCVEGQFAAPDTSGAVQLLTWLAGEFGGTLPDFDRQALAAKRLFQAGWSRREIYDCWKSLTARKDRPATLTEVWFAIGPWLVRREAAATLARIQAESAERKARQQAISEMAGTMLRLVDKPLTMREMAEERLKRRGISDAAQASRSMTEA